MGGREALRISSDGSLPGCLVPAPTLWKQGILGVIRRMRLLDPRYADLLWDAASQMV